jgi:hypothetical protein
LVVVQSTLSNRGRPLPTAWVVVSELISRSVPVMTGTAALLLFLAFIISVSPGIHRKIKRQREYAGSWEDVHAASELKRSLSVGTTATGLSRSKTWMKRMTRMGR